MKSKGAENSDNLLVAEICGVHGVKGMVKLKIFIEEPEDLMKYKPLRDLKTGKNFEFINIAQHQNTYLASLKGVEDRNAAEALKGTKLYINRSQLPEINENDTYYSSDLIGLEVIDSTGDVIGTVLRVNNFGAADLLEIRRSDNGKTFYLPFTNECVPNVDINKKQITIVIPSGLLD